MQLAVDQPLTTQQPVMVAPMQRQQTGGAISQRWPARKRARESECEDMSSELTSRSQKRMKNEGSVVVVMEDVVMEDASTAAKRKYETTTEDDQDNDGYPESDSDPYESLQAMSRQYKEMEKTAKSRKIQRIEVTSQDDQLRKRCDILEQEMAQMKEVMGSLQRQVSVNEKMCFARYGYKMDADKHDYLLDRYIGSKGSAVEKGAKTSLAKVKAGSASGQAARLKVAKTDEPRGQGGGNGKASKVKVQKLIGEEKHMDENDASNYDEKLDSTTEDEL